MEVEISIDMWVYNYLITPKKTILLITPVGNVKGKIFLVKFELKIL